MIKSKAAKENVILTIILVCLITILVGMSYAFLKTSFLEIRLCFESRKFILNIR